MGTAVEVARTVKNIVLGASPWVPGESRYGVDSFTPQELTAAIASDFPGARIERITVDRDPRGTTDRARLHLSWNAAGRDTGLPAKWLQKRDDVPAVVKRLRSLYLDNQAALDRVWESLPPTFCHGDTHAGNTYMRADGTAGVFDWQQPHKMHGMRDVTYFIGWSMDPVTRRAAEKDSPGTSTASRSTPCTKCPRLLTLSSFTDS